MRRRAPAALAASSLFAAISVLAAAVATPPAAAQDAAAPARATAAPTRAAAIARFERALAHDVARDSVGSIAAAVVVNGEVVWEGAFGWADRDRRILATPATIYRVGSITKTVTALTLLRLVDEGAVSLDDAVVDAIPELRRLANLPADRPPITYRQLASHTAGLDREPGADYTTRGPFDRWKRTLVRAIPTTAVVAPPGTEYRYSNIGYGILGFALERAAGRPYERLVQEHVLDPLGMSSASFVVPRSQRHRLAVGYVNPAPDSVDPRVPRAEHRGRGYKVPNGGLYATVGDIARLIPALSAPEALGAPAGARQARAGAETAGPRVGTPAESAGRLLPERLRRLMLTDPLDDDAPAGYGLGLQLQRPGDTLLAGHSGAVAGYTAYLLFHPATATGVVLLRNYNQGQTNLGSAATTLLLDLL